MKPAPEQLVFLTTTSYLNAQACTFTMQVCVHLLLHNFNTATFIVGYMLRSEIQLQMFEVQIQMPHNLL